ncbi:MAG: hypothetical protein ACQEUB_08410 [Thermodesulfobacteriota bacterium]
MSTKSCRPVFIAQALTRKLSHVYEQEIKHMHQVAVPWWTRF